jgi:cell wall-associated NlpC family hydrolase
MTTRQDIVDAAYEQIGTPWVHQGRLPGVALDCAGLVIVVARKLGLVPPDFDINGYQRMPDGSMPHTLRQYMVSVRRENMAPGDVVSMAFDKDPQHVGIVVPYRHGGLAMVHAASKPSKGDRNGKVEGIRLMFLGSRFTGAYSFPGMAPWPK